MNRALLVGINTYPSAPLRGCLNDIRAMATFLTEQCDFALEDIRLLADKRATKTAIVERLGWLLNGLRAGDRVLFQFSGHGVQLPTRNPQGEVDGLDEAICPYDFDWTDAHTIRDKEFAQIFANIPKGVEFIWISDSCHSGDLTKAMPPEGILNKTLLPPLDIDWRLQTAKSKNIRSRGMQRTAQQLNLALISGCEDKQTSADAYIKGNYHGALTYFLLDELQKKDGLSLPLNKLIKKVRKALKAKGYPQVPQLEGSEIIQNKGFLAV